ncbi:MAG: NAD(P)H-binding protein, partial [Planctomycetes bacterium]|nr:NAD(P)H-binding protein [Planctomycetota bacterium]
MQNTINVAVLGATGCVGANLLRKLIKSTNYRIIASYRSDKSKKHALKSPRIDWRRVNLQDPASTRDFMRGGDVLVYLVHSLSTPEFENLDVELGHKAAEAAMSSGIRKIIYLSGII